VFEKSETGSHFNHHNWKIGKVMRREGRKCEKFHLILGIVRNGKVKRKFSNMGMRGLMEKLRKIAGNCWEISFKKMKIAEKRWKTLKIQKFNTQNSSFPINAQKIATTVRNSPNPQS
jgi:hypothetical protein